MSKEIKLKIAILDDSGKLVEIPQFIQKHINQIEKRWFEKMKKLDENYKKQIHELEHRLSNCIEPKFKVGQIVWHCYKNCNAPVKTVIESIDIEVNEKFIDFTYYDIAGFGFDEIMLFATEEEAKAKLEELKNG